jgi:hypothetical protein
MRNGHFSATDLPPIFDRLARTTDAQGNFRFQQFPGNRIPTNRLSSFPHSSSMRCRCPIFRGSVNNSVGSSRGITNNHDFGVRGDHNFNENDRLSGFYQYTNAALSMEVFWAIRPATRARTTLTAFGSTGVILVYSGRG